MHIFILTACGQLTEEICADLETLPDFRVSYHRRLLISEIRLELSVLVRSQLKKTLE